MQFYHGTHVDTKKILPPHITGNIRKSEATRKVAKDVVFITPDKGYAGVYGKVKQVIPFNQRPYHEYLTQIGEHKKASKAKKSIHEIWVCDWAIVV